MGVGVRAALAAYLDEINRRGDHGAAVVSAAECLDDPWEVVTQAGLLARCRPAIAKKAQGLKDDLSLGSPRASGVFTIPRGATYPHLDTPYRRIHGAFDTPKTMARRLVDQALGAVEGEVQVGLDPACGTGAFLVAMAERGVTEIRGFDVDELAVSVARIAVPRAKLLVADAFTLGEQADLVVGNPPFVPPERQNKALRRQLRQRFPWLNGRFDLFVPFSALAVECCREGGGVRLVLPWPILSQPYGVGLRRAWLEKHRFVEVSGPHAFPGASVQVVLLVMQKGRGPAGVPPHWIRADELLRLENAPLDPNLEIGDIALAQWVRGRSRPMGDVCLVDTGLVAHGPDGPKSRLMRDGPGPGVVPYADARDFFRGKNKFLSYEPRRMHRAKQPSMFEQPKIVIQRLRGKNPIRAAIDRSGIYVGHTCTIVQPLPTCPVSLSRLLELIMSPVVSAITRIERGHRLDLYPHDVAAFPIPLRWWDSPDTPIKEALELNDQQLDRCAAIDAN